MIKYKKQVTCIVLIYSYFLWTKTQQLFFLCKKTPFYFMNFNRKYNSLKILKLIKASKLSYEIWFFQSPKLDLAQHAVLLTATANLISKFWWVESCIRQTKYIKRSIKNKLSVLWLIQNRMNICFSYFRSWILIQFNSWLKNFPPIALSTGP